MISYEWEAIGGEVGGNGGGGNAVAPLFLPVPFLPPPPSFADKYNNVSYVEVKV